METMILDEDKQLRVLRAIRSSDMQSRKVNHYVAMARGGEEWQPMSNAVGNGSEHKLRAVCEDPPDMSYPALVRLSLSSCPNHCHRIMT